MAYLVAIAPLGGPVVPWKFRSPRPFPALLRDRGDQSLTEQHGDTLGPWFDKVEHAAINDAKDFIASDAKGDEAALVGKGATQ